MENGTAMSLTLKRVLVTGGAGFLGPHLCERLVARGDDVLCVDNYFTGRKDNLAHLLGDLRFETLRHDVTFPLYVEVDENYNLACPVSPVHYQFDPVQTAKTSVIGAINMLGLAKRTHARVLQASTSEVYGDPVVHPQTEDYRGNVNPLGPAPVTPRASTPRKRCSSITAVSTRCGSKWPTSSTPVVRAFTPMTGAWYPISSFRPCKANRSSSTATVCRRDRSVMSMI